MNLPSKGSFKMPEGNENEGNEEPSNRSLVTIDELLETMFMDLTINQKFCKHVVDSVVEKFYKSKVMPVEKETVILPEIVTSCTDKRSEIVAHNIRILSRLIETVMETFINCGMFCEIFLIYLLLYCFFFFFLFL